MFRFLKFFIKSIIDFFYLPPVTYSKVIAFVSELYEICLVRAKDKLKIMHDADTDSLSSYNGKLQIPFIYIYIRFKGVFIGDRTLSIVISSRFLSK